MTTERQQHQLGFESAVAVVKGLPGSTGNHIVDCTRITPASVNPLIIACLLSFDLFSDTTQTGSSC
jgi:hypothetical protein